MEGKIVIVKHVKNEGAGFIEEVLATDDCPVEIVDLAQGHRLPEHIDEIAALIVLGGPMSVYQERGFPFLKQEERLIRKLLIEEIPFLGICLGAQLLAKTCGAKVHIGAAREVGWYTAALTTEGKQDLFFRGFPNRFEVFQWHDDTFDIPEGGLLLGVGKTCRNQAFRVGQNAYGLQFHMEVTPDMIEDWTGNGISGADVQKILDEEARSREQFRTRAIQLFSNFKQVIEASLRIRRVIRMFVEDEKESKKKRAILWWNIREHSLLPAKA
jgi:GMP synthase (glutamine-hydrolysing)